MLGIIQRASGWIAQSRHKESESTVARPNRQHELAGVRDNYQRLNVLGRERLILGPLHQFQCLSNIDVDDPITLGVCETEMRAREAGLNGTVWEWNILLMCAVRYSSRKIRV